MADDNTRDDAGLHEARVFFDTYCANHIGEPTWKHLRAALDAIHARDAALRDAREEIENLQADADMDGTMIRKLREQDVRLRKQIAAERASIVAMLRREAETGPVGALAACRYCADMIERAQPGMTARRR